MDQILKSYLANFVDDNGLQDLNEATAFEHFVNHTLISKIHPDPFNLDDITIGGGQDTGIDGLAVLVNDHIVNSTEAVDYFCQKINRFEVKFIFIQSKTSAKFDSGDLGNFMFGVRNFFDETSDLPMNPQIKNFREVKNYIYTKSSDLDNIPICEMYYVTTGEWTKDATLEVRVQSEKTELEKTKLFSTVRFIPVDNEHLKRLYLELRRKINKEINFEKHTALPSIGKVHQAYIGILPALEYLKLITDDDGNLAKSLFYDNVRDFQGNNSVNEEIQSTINDPEQSDRFALLNNGITIVAKKIQQIGSRFSIQNYQVVNGCQTSHLIFHNKSALTENMFVPLKLIVTDNNEVIDQIIRATNRQTQVSVEAFESIKTFHKELEEFYNTFKDGLRLYYERRSKQYYGLKIKPTQIITLATQTHCFLGMFLNEPHSNHRYYGEILKAYKDKFFQEQHHFYPYYLSGYTFALLNQLFSEQKLNSDKKIFRFHLMMLFRLSNSPIEYDTFSYGKSKKHEKYYDDLRKVLLDENQALIFFKEAAQIIDKTLEKVSYTPKEATRRKDFTNDLIKLLREQSGGITPTHQGFEPPKPKKPKA